MRSGEQVQIQLEDGCSDQESHAYFSLVMAARIVSLPCILDEFTCMQNTIQMDDFVRDVT